MNKTKIYFLILLLICYICYNCIFNEKFISLESHYHTYYDTSGTAVDITKPTLTLYYDRYDKYSKYFYDDTKAIALYNLEKETNELNEEYKFFERVYNENISVDEKIEDFNIPFKTPYYFRTKTNKKDSEDELYDDKIEQIYELLRSSKYYYEKLIELIEDVRSYLDSLEDRYKNNKKEKINKKSDFNEDLSLISNEVFNDKKDIVNKYLENKYKETSNFLILNHKKKIDNVIKDNNFGVWNQIKLLYKEGCFPYLHKNMITLEEVYCKDGEMPECVSKTMRTYNIEKDSYSSSASSSASSNPIQKYSQADYAYILAILYKRALEINDATSYETVQNIEKAYKSNIIYFIMEHNKVSNDELSKAKKTLKYHSDRANGSMGNVKNVHEDRIFIYNLCSDLYKTVYCEKEEDCKQLDSSSINEDIWDEYICKIKNMVQTKELEKYKTKLDEYLIEKDVKNNDIDKIKQHTEFVESCKKDSADSVNKKTYSSDSSSSSSFEVDLTKTKQFPRDEKIVDKLPKIIFTYQKYEPEGLVDGKNTKVIEYDGIYNVNNEFITLGRNNLLKFLETVMTERLEIIQGANKEDKKIYHKNNISNINNSEHNHFENEKKQINFEKKELPDDIRLSPHFDLNFKNIIKCDKCSEFIKVYD